MATKGIMGGTTTNLPDLEYPCPICLLAKATTTPIGPTIDISKVTPGFMIQMDFLFSMLKESVDLSRLCGNMFFYFIPIWISI